MTKKIEPVISLADISKTYISGPIRYQALKNISFNVDKGEFVAITGASGSGKSTLMNIIGALDLPTSGVYLLNSRNISNYDEDELAEIRNKQIGFIFQSFNLLPRTTVFKNVERIMIYAGLPANERKEKVKKILNDLGIADKTDNISNHLSGGQIQKVAIARALVMNPTIILADEPTGNLDSKNSHEIMNIFTQLNQKGNTIIMITHEADIASYAKRIISLKDGCIVSDTTKQ